MYLEVLSSFLCAFIDQLPTEATFRLTEITIRIGEAPKTREMLLSGFQNAQSTEALMKAEDASDEPPRNGELLTIAEADYKITSVTPLLSLSEPAGYRLLLQKTI